MMAAAFGNTWTSQFGESPSGIVGGVWASMLSGLSGQHLGVGMAAMKAEKLTFPPTAPNFRAMCFAIPSLAELRNEFRKPVFERNPFATLVYGYLDHTAYKHATKQQSDRMTEEAYEQGVSWVMQGNPLPEKRAQIAAPELEPRTKARPLTVEAELEKMRRVLEGEYYPTVETLEAERDQC